MAVRLITYLSDGSTFELDVDQKEVIDFTKQLLDITDIAKRKSDWSKEFILPDTERNSYYFGYFFDTGVQGVEYDLYKANHIDIFDNNMQIFTGNLELISYNDKKHQYKVVAFGLLNTLSNILSVKKMSELNLSYLAHEHTLANIVLSWNLGLPAGPHAGKIVYPIADYGRGYGAYTTLPTGSRGYWDVTNASTPLMLNDLRPAILLKEVVDALFSQAGVGADMGIMDTPEFGEIYMQLHREILLGSVLTLYEIYANFTDLTNWVIPVAETRIPLNVVPPSSLYDNVLNEFTAQVEGTHQFKWHINTNGGVGPRNNTITVYKNAVSQYTLTQSQTINQFIGEVSISLISGDTVSITLQTSQLSNSNYIGVGEDNYFELENNTAPAADTTIYPQLFMEKINQLEFLTSVLQTFNLVIIGDLENFDLYRIYTWEDYFTSGVRKDWTDKVNENVAGTIQPTNDILNKDILLSWMDSEDIGNKVIKDRTGHPFGAFHRQTNVAYTQDTKKIDTIFMPYVTDGIGYGIYGILGISMAKYYSSVDSFGLQEMNPQLFFYNGLLDISAIGQQPYYDYDTLTPAATLLNLYPMCTPYTVRKLNTTQWYVDADEFELNFAGAQPMSIYPIFWTDYPDRNIYTEYFQAMFTELYSTLNRILTLSMLLTPEDVSNFKFNDLIGLNYRGTPDIWRVQKIEDYWLGQLKECKVIFTKALAVPTTEEVGVPEDFEVTNYEVQTYSSWSAPGVSVLAVAGYNIYRSYNLGYGYNKVNTSLITGTEFFDTTVIGNRNYYYKVTAVGSFGGESLATTPVFCDRFDSLVGEGASSRFAYGNVGTDPKIMVVDRLTLTSTDGAVDGTGGVDYRGSLYYCLAQTFPRIIFFETSGTIDAMTAGNTINVGGPYCYLVGHSAPNPGVEYLGGNVDTTNNNHDVLLRHIHFSKSDTPNNVDAMTLRKMNVIMDRVTTRWGRDEVASCADQTGLGDAAIGFLKSFMYESLMNDNNITKDAFGHPYICLGYARNKTWYLNCMAFGTERFPLANQTFGDQRAKLALINNLTVGGWNRTCADVGDATTVEGDIVHIGNKALRMNNEHVHADQKYGLQIRGGTDPDNTKIYVADVGCELKEEGEVDDDCVKFTTGEWVNEITPPFDISEYEIYSETEVQALVLAKGGSKWWDEHDRRIAADIEDFNARPYGLDNAFNSSSLVVSGMLNSPSGLPARAVNWFNTVDGDVSGGINFSVVNYSVTLTVTSGGVTYGPMGLVLNENCIVFAAVVQHINDRLAAMGFDAVCEAYNPGGDSTYVCLRTLGTGPDEEIIMASNSSSVLGWVDRTFLGEDAGGHHARDVNTHSFTFPANPHDVWGDGIITNLEKWIVDTFSTAREEVNLAHLNFFVNGGGIDTTDWLNPTGGVAEFWSVYANGGYIATIVTGNGFTGNAQYVEYDDASGYFFLVQTLTGLTIGKTYDFSMMFRCSDGIRVYVDGATGIFTRTSAQTGNAISSGVQSFVATATEHAIRIYGNPATTPGWGDWIAVDEMTWIEQE